MNGKRVFLVLGLVVSLAGLWLIFPILVRRSSHIPESQLQEIVYVDVESGDAFLLRARTSRATNPVTGEQTLIPGMYCSECKAWKPVGSMEMLQTKRAVRNCPIHKTPLSQGGPTPDELAE